MATMINSQVWAPRVLQAWMFDTHLEAERNPQWNLSQGCMPHKTGMMCKRPLFPLPRHQAPQQSDVEYRVLKLLTPALRRSLAVLVRKLSLHRRAHFHRVLLGRFAIPGLLASVSSCILPEHFCGMRSSHHHPKSPENLVPPSRILGAPTTLAASIGRNAPSKTPANENPATALTTSASSCPWSPKRAPSTEIMLHACRRQIPHSPMDVLRTPEGPMKRLVASSHDPTSNRDPHTSLGEQTTNPTPTNTSLG